MDRVVGLILLLCGGMDALAVFSSLKVRPSALNQHTFEGMEIVGEIRCHLPSRVPPHHPSPTRSQSPILRHPFHLTSTPCRTPARPRDPVALAVLWRTTFW